MTLEELHARLDGFRSLKKDWDGYGADPPMPFVIDVAHLWINAIPQGLFSGCHACPTGAGGLEFEWHCDGRELEIGFRKESAFDYLMCPSKDESTWREGLRPWSDIEKAVKLIQWVKGADSGAKP